MPLVLTPCGHTHPHHPVPSETTEVVPGKIEPPSIVAAKPSKYFMNAIAGSFSGPHSADSENAHAMILTAQRPDAHLQHHIKNERTPLMITGGIRPIQARCIGVAGVAATMQ